MSQSLAVQYACQSAGSLTAVAYPGFATGGQVERRRREDKGAGANGASGCPLPTGDFRSQNVDF